VLRPRAHPLPLLFVTVGCAAPSSNEDLAQIIAELQERQSQQECGLRGAMGMGGHGGARLGDAVRACNLPTAENVALACAAHQATPNPDRRDPENPDELQYDFPDYVVSALSCAFDDAGNSSATCTFELATENAPPQPVRAAFVHTFYARSTPLTFGYGTTWSTAGSCLRADGADSAT